MDSPRSLGQRARSRRWQAFTRRFPDIEQLTVIDLGGTVEYWLRAPVRPRRVHVVNLEASGVEPPEWIHVHHGDACDLPEDVTSRSYDLVYSNSVIEHVGGHLNRLRFSSNVNALAPRHWIQTPYRYFPIEPHWVCPFMQFLPLKLRAAVGLRWPLVHTRPADYASALDAQMQVELQSVTQMRAYFPASTIDYERAGGLVKSLIAIRAGE